MTAYHLITGITLIIAGALIGWIGLAGRKGTLKPNFWIGIRTSALMASEQKWMVGHRAAASQLSTAGIGVIVAGVLCLFVPFDMVAPVSMGSIVWLAIFLVWGGIEATKAAKQV